MKKLILALALVTLSLSCQKSNNTAADNTAAITSTHQYGMSNGSCYDFTSAAYVAASFCSNVANSGYSLNNGVCYSTTTGQAVATSFCSNTNTNSGYSLNNGTCYSTTTGQPVATTYCSGGSNTNGACYGTYIYSGNGQQQYGTCNGANCRGYTLIQASTGQTVMCQ